MSKQEESKKLNKNWFPSNIEKTSPVKTKLIKFFSQVWSFYIELVMPIHSI